MVKRLFEKEVAEVTGENKDADVSVLFSEAIKAVHVLNIMYG